jgi:glycolate oxidase iron-sulfur subunit
MTACPSGVDYGKLIEATRAQVERRYRRPVTERLHRRLIYSLFPNVRLLRMLGPALRVYQRTGAQRFLRGLLPERLASMEALLPPLDERHEIPEVTPAQGSRRARVGLQLGCVQREFVSEINVATVRVLAAEGCEVVAPRLQGCCGALQIHAGDEGPALDHARRLIDVFEQANVDFVITNAGGCGSNVRQYGHQLRDDARYAARARNFSAKCRDVAEFLAELGPRARRHPVKARVAYHDSCHLQHAQRVRTQPRELLRSIPDLEVAEVPEAALCCGSAGIYNLLQRETATVLADRKAGHIARLKPAVVATGNVGCLLQLQAALRRAGESIRVVHTIQILDASIRGLPLG